MDFYPTIRFIPLLCMKDQASSFAELKAAFLNCPMLTRKYHKLRKLFLHIYIIYQRYFQLFFFLSVITSSTKYVESNFPLIYVDGIDTVRLNDGSSGTGRYFD